MQLNGSQIFVEVLVEHGVDTIFGYPGGAVLNLYDELYKNSDRIRHVLTAHEQGASHAADGYTRATGKTGVVLSTSGPGATNLVTGIATAYMDSVPVVAFTGNVGTSLLGKDSFQEVYIEGIVKPVTKASFTVRRVEDLADTMRRAFQIARSGRRGPVLVDLPKDITAAVCDFEHQAPWAVQSITDFDEDAVQRAAEHVRAAKRPLIIIGGGVRSANAAELVKKLAHLTEIPCIHTLMGAGVLCYKDPLNLGLVGMHGTYSANMAVSNADLILSLGTRFSDRVALRPSAFAKDATLIQVDLDTKEIGKNVEMDLSIVGDVACVTKALIELVDKGEHSEWKEQIAQWAKNDYVPPNDDSRIVPQRMISKICEMCGPDAYYVTDVGQHQMWAAQYIKHVDPRHFITSGGLGTMGFGYGASIGTQIALGKDTRVVMLTGDGSFHMNMNEACTAVSYKLPIITVIFNNSALGMVRQWQSVFYEGRYSQTSPDRLTDYVKLAEGFGAKGFRCTTPKEFEDVFAKALEMDGPVWIDCVIDPDEMVLPMIPAGGVVEDMIMAWPGPG